MKKVLICLFSSIILLACGEDDPVIMDPEPAIDIQGFSFEITEILPTSVEVEFISNTVKSSGGDLITEIWYKVATDSEWSKKDVIDSNPQQAYVLDGLKKATKYLIKPVYTIDNLTKESSERTFTTLPFEYFAKRFGMHRALITSADNSVDIDFEELDAAPNFFITHKGDSLEMKYTTISKDSILISLDSNNSLFFEEESLVEQLNIPLQFKIKDYSNRDVLGQDLEIYNNQPKIDSLIVSQVRDCDGFKRVQLSFRGLFWDPLTSPTSTNNPDNYRVKISSVQDPSISTPIMTIDEYDSNSSSFNQGCKDGFRTVIDIPVQNFFHRASILWIAFPQDLLPEGVYELQFSVLKNDNTYSAKSFEFNLEYD